MMNTRMHTYLSPALRVLAVVPPSVLQMHPWHYWPLQQNAIRRAMCKYVRHSEHNRSQHSRREQTQHTFNHNIPMYEIRIYVRTLH